MRDVVCFAFFFRGACFAWYTCSDVSLGAQCIRGKPNTRTSLFFLSNPAPRPRFRPSSSSSSSMATTATTTATVMAPAATANFVPTPTPPHPRPTAPPALRAPSTLGPVKSEVPPTPSSSTATAAAAAAAAAGSEDPSYIITVPSYSGNQTRALAPRLLPIVEAKTCNPNRGFASQRGSRSTPSTTRSAAYCRSSSRGRPRRRLVAGVRTRTSTTATP